MPIERISDTIALKRVSENPYSNWPKRDGGDNRVEPIAKPMFRTARQVSPGDKIFTIGSCFARNVEQELDKRGFRLPAWDVIKQDPEFTKFGPNILNNYAVGSIYNEVAWAFDPSYEFVDEASFFEIYPGKFIDIHLNRGFKPASLDTVRARRAAITAVYRQISNCPLVIITLGLAESWFDTKTSVYLNARPHHAMFSKNPGRYELHVMDYADVMRCLHDTFELLQANLCPDGKVLLTISPVPLQSTYRDCDVMVANTYSKAVLRAAAEEITASYDFVAYYPSFESVSLTRRDLAWEDDQTHVKKGIVDVNVSRMIAAYTGSGEDGANVPSDAALEIVDSIRNKVRLTPSAIFGALENAGDTLMSEPEIALAFCEACLDLKKLDLAKSALARLPMLRIPRAAAKLFDRPDFVRGGRHGRCGEGVPRIAR